MLESGFRAVSPEKALSTQDMSRVKNSQTFLITFGMSRGDENPASRRKFSFLRQSSPHS
jgi:hypothetical protein